MMTVSDAFQIVMPAQAGIQSRETLDSRFRGNDSSGNVSNMAAVHP